MAEQCLRDNFDLNDIFTVFNFYSSVVFRFSQIKRNTSTASSDMSNLIESEETDSSLFRIGGGPLAGISNRVSGKKLWKATIWSKYKYTCKTAQHPFNNIVALIKMTSQEKSRLPRALAFRDRGRMLFPKQQLLPFVRCVIASVSKYTNFNAVKMFGKKLLLVCENYIIR